MLVNVGFYVISNEFFIVIFFVYLDMKYGDLKKMHPKMRCISLWQNVDRLEI